MREKKKAIDLLIKAGKGAAAAAAIVKLADSLAPVIQSIGTILPGVGHFLMHFFTGASIIRSSDEGDDAAASFQEMASTDDFTSLPEASNVFFQELVEEE